MFDSPPPNLPVEPTPGNPPPQKSPTPPVAPPAPPSSPATQQPSASSGGPVKREPEDIFASVDKPTAPPTQPPATVNAPMSGGGSGLKIALIVMAVILVLAAGGYAAWVFLIRPQPTEVASQPQAQVTPLTERVEELPTTTTEPDVIIEEPPIQPETPTNIPLPTPTEETQSTPPTSPQIPELVIPAVEPVEAADDDADGLSNEEEALLATSATSKDSDGDTFEDGSELKNGYDPAQPGVKISAASTLHGVDIASGWSVTVPRSWILGIDRATPGNYAIQTGGLETFSIQISDKSVQESFIDWLALREPNVDGSTLRPFVTKAGLRAWQSADRLRTYVITETTVVVIGYQLNGSGAYRYRALYDYTIQSLNKSGA